MQHSVHDKLLAALERISEAFKSLLWEKAKVLGISPIQIQILLFIESHRSEYSKVSQLAKEFNLTKPTVSDAVKVLMKKGLLQKEQAHSGDSRSYELSLTKEGKKLTQDLGQYDQPLLSSLQGLEQSGVEESYFLLTQLIHSLHQKGILSVQRTCYGCQFYEHDAKGHFCHLLQSRLKPSEIRIDCSEYEDRAA